MKNRPKSGPRAPARRTRRPKTEVRRATPAEYRRSPPILAEKPKGKDVRKITTKTKDRAADVVPSVVKKDPLRLRLPAIPHRVKLAVGGLVAAAGITFATVNANSVQSSETRRASASESAVPGGEPLPTLSNEPQPDLALSPAPEATKVKPKAEPQLDTTAYFTDDFAAELRAVTVLQKPDPKDEAKDVVAPAPVVVDPETTKVIVSLSAHGFMDPDQKIKGKKLTLEQLVDDLRGLSLRFDGINENTFIAFQDGTDLTKFPQAQVQIKISTDGKLTAAGEEVQGYLSFKSPFSGIQALLEAKKITASRAYIGATVDRERDAMLSDGYRLTKNSTADAVGLHGDTITYYMYGTKRVTDKDNANHESRRRVVIEYKIGEAKPHVDRSEMN